MRFTLYDLLLEIDVDKTKRLCCEWDEARDGCDCAGCRNYRLAAETFPPEVRAFFRELGLDEKKPTEVFPWHAEDGGRALHYGGFYHLCGTIVKGSGRYDVADGYSVAFTDDISLPEEHLPSPALQMEIDFCGVPWLLEEKDPY